MARARSPNSIEAEEMYKNGMKLVDIAKKLDVPASTVRRWKSTQNWDGKTKGKKNERSQKKKANARHKGGQPGNRNAVGNKGGPLKPGDKIAEKHGAYSSVYWDVLDESEKDMIEEIPVVMISSEDSASFIRRAYEMGVSDYISRPYDAQIVYNRKRNLTRDREPSRQHC